MTKRRSENQHSILITRPEPQASEDCAYFAAHGIQAVKLPLLRYETRPFSLPDQIDEYALIATSMQAIRILAATLSPAQKTHLTLYVVGEQSRKLALSLGFQTIMTGGGTARSLAEHLQAATKPAQKFLYLRGEDVSFDLAAALQKSGLLCMEQTIYKAHQAPAIPDDILAAFQSRSISAIMLYSVRSAEALAKLVRVHNLENMLKSIHLLSLSANVLECVRIFEWAGTYSLDAADSDALKAHALSLFETQ